MFLQIMAAQCVVLIMVCLCCAYCNNKQKAYEAKERQEKELDEIQDKAKHDEVLPTERSLLDNSAENVAPMSDLSEHDIYNPKELSTPEDTPFELAVSPDITRNKSNQP